jgi:hypothetical protein
MAEGEFVLLRQHLQAAVSAAVSLRGLPCSDHDLYAMLADAAAQQRDLAALRAYAPRAATLAESDGHVLYQAIAQRALATLCRLEGNAAAAETRLQQALDLFRTLGTPWQVARTQVELGELARARSDRDRARGLLAAALAGFDALGAVPDAARVAAALRTLD